MRLCITGYFQGEYMYMLSKDGLIMNYKEYGMNKQKTVTVSLAMVARPYIKKTRTNYFGFGKKKRRKRTYFGRGTAFSFSRPYVNKRYRLILGEGKRKKRKKIVNKKVVLSHRSSPRLHLLQLI